MRALFLALAVSILVGCQRDGPRFEASFQRSIPADELKMLYLNGGYAGEIEIEGIDSEAISIAGVVRVARRDLRTSVARYVVDKIEKEPPIHIENELLILGRPGQQGWLKHAIVDWKIRVPRRFAVSVSSNGTRPIRVRRVSGWVQVDAEWAEVSVEEAPLFKSWAGCFYGHEWDAKGNPACRHLLSIPP